MRKTKLFAALLAAALVFNLAACGNSGTAGSTETTAAVETETTAAEAGSDETTEENSDFKTIRDAIAAYTDKVDEPYGYEISYALAYDEELQSTSEDGWRLSGSDAEHKTADYISEEMTAIGLTDVEKVPVTVDSWDYTHGSLSIDGLDLAIKVYPYATTGTDDDGLTAEIVDVGTGTMDEYEGLDVKDKIVLVGVDQVNEQWIDVYMDEADLHGAAAIVIYAYGKEGYATLSDDDSNIHDVCDTDIMPCVSISRNEAKAIQEAIAAGNNQATLIVDSKVSIGDGIAYNVIGRIAGKSSDEIIIVSAHYDKYFWGFQDDSTAMGLIMAIAKTMKDAGYEPQNDIYFVAHAAEEWGTSGSQSDYTTGAWEMINNARPEWQGKIKGMLNFELAALYDGATELQFSGPPEMATLVKNFVDGGFAPAPVNNIYADGISSEIVEAGVMEDGISYRLAGTPYIVNMPGMQDGPDGWYQQRYHTQSDDKDTYSADVMATNIAEYGAMAIYIDMMPALELDLELSADTMENGLDADTAKLADIDTESYAAAVEAMRTAAAGLNDKINAVNEKYREAAADGASAEELDAIYAEGREVNAVTLKAFKYIQDNFTDIIIAGEVGSFHTAYQENVAVLTAVIDALNAGNLSSEDGDGAIDIAYMINYGGEYGKYYFSPETNKVVEDMLSNPESQRNYSTGRGFTFADTKGATRSILEKVMAEEEDPDVSEETAIYEDALTAQKQLYKDAVDAEIEAMNGFADVVS